MFHLIFFTLVDFGLLIGSSHGIEEICYGGTYQVPIYYTPPLFTTSIYFKPRGEERTLAVSEGKSQHKRFLVGVGSIRVKDLTEQDDGASLFFGQHENVELKISDCQEPQSSSYGDLFSWKVPFGAEYLEFSKMSSQGFALKPQVIWNRTDETSGRGTVKRNYYELKNLKQKDSGYYKFMGAGGKLIRWKRLNVKENDRHFERKEGERLEMDFSVKFSTVHRIQFTSRESGDEKTYDRQYMDHRMELTDSFFSFWDLLYEDSGTYEFIDDDGFLAMRMVLEVEYPQLPTWVYILGLAIIVFCIIFCCCCVKKCCCKKSSNKRSSSGTAAAAPQVFYHDSNQPVQPVIPLLSREPKVAARDPRPTYNPVVENMDLPPSTQVTAPGGPGPTSTSMVSTSSDSGPTFEFKGMAFPSAPPLSSGTSIQDVYTSDKLNFL